MTLSAPQRAALDHVTGRARARAERARERIDEVLRMSDLAPEVLDAAVARVKSHARVALHFHPDRPDRGGRPVAEGLLEDGVYRSQFETGLSSGSVSAYPGGDRDRWEREIFGGAYHAEVATPADRPKYGALDLMLHPDGPSPRFGSCYLLLAPAASARCTFTYLDSHRNPEEKGTFEAFDDIVAALLTEVFERDFAIGEPDLSPPRLLHHLGSKLGGPFADPSGREPRRNLNHYVEAQVHGQVSLDRDAERLVADPSFEGTGTGDVLRALCERYDVALHWHAGFALAPEAVPADFRGPAMPSLARRVALDGRVDAGAIGRAAVALRRDPAAWSDRGSYEEVRQELKLLWHVLVRFGAPLRDFRS